LKYDILQSLCEAQLRSEPQLIFLMKTFLLFSYLTFTRIGLFLFIILVFGISSKEHLIHSQPNTVKRQRRATAKVNSLALVCAQCGVRNTLPRIRVFRDHRLPYVHATNS
jgi:hypothetical protein